MGPFCIGACILPSMARTRAPPPTARRAPPAAVDEMGHRIDELENSIGELMAQAGIDDEPAVEGAAPTEPPRPDAASGA